MKCFCLVQLEISGAEISFPGGCVCGGDRVPGGVQGSEVMEAVLDRNPFLLKCSPPGVRESPRSTELADHGQNRVTPGVSHGQV